MRIRVQAIKTSKYFIVEVDPRKIKEVKKEAIKILDEAYACHKHCARLVGTWDCHRICDDNEFYGALEIAKKIGEVREDGDYDVKMPAYKFLGMIADW